MNVLITGASGLIGSALANSLARDGHHIIKLNRSSRREELCGPCWDPAREWIYLNESAPFDFVVHLAGESIAQRWTARKKIRIRESRVNGTRLLNETLARFTPLPRALLCASATGFYGSRGDEWLDERSAPGSGFLPEVCREWEAAAAVARQKSIRVVHLRFGIVLSSRGGALAKMLPAFRLGLGGKLGDGRQWWSWIALEDALGVIRHALTDESLSGPVNVVSPNPATNLEFTKTLACVLRRPAFFAVPRVALELFFGEMGREALLASFRVKPAKLEQRGFTFQFPDLESALRQALGR